MMAVLEKGRKMSIFRCCYNVNKLLVTYYLDGSISSCKTLSWYSRPSSRSNQPIEGTNKNKNVLNRELNCFRKNTGESWLMTGSVLEKRCFVIGLKK